MVDQPVFFHSAKNRFCLSQLLKKLNSTERGALFRHFCVSKVITTAHAHKSGVIFHFFQELSNKKIKALRPKMTENSLKGGSCLFDGARSPFSTFCVSKVITTAHAHKKVCHFSFFPRSLKHKKMKALRPKMAKIAWRGPALKEKFGGTWISHNYVLGFVVLKNVVRVFSGQFFFVSDKEDREESSTKFLGGRTRPKDAMGSQIVSSESDISHSYLFI